MATRRNTKTQARRSGGNTRSGGGTSPLTIFVVGAALGAAVLFGAPRLLKEDGTDGFLRPKPNADAEPATMAVEQRVADGDGVVAAPSGAKPEVAAAAEPVSQGTEFDFYNVLPNKEVDMTPEQQAALNAAEARRHAQATAAEARRAQAAAVAAASAQDQADAGVQVMPDMDLPKPVTAPAAKPTASNPAPVAAPAARQPEAPKALPKPVAAAPAPAAPVAAVRDRPVKSAATTAAEAPKPRAKAVAAYASSPDVTAGSRNMVMPAASLDPTRTFEKPATASAKPAAKPAAAAAPAESSKVVVQAGAYSDKDQAEKVKAKIAMLGLGARVESSTADGKSVYRVRLGPYAENSTDLANAKRALSGGGLGAMEVRL